LNFLVKSNVERKIYNIFGYKGKQVRDNIHAKDLVNFIRYFIFRPRIGEVYNLGGGIKNSISILEAFDLVYKHSGIRMKFKYKNKNRIGDHICYYSDLSKARKHYPGWDINISLDKIICDILYKINNVKK
jgi:CDP-paratose 2-epimerase